MRYWHSWNKREYLAIKVHSHKIAFDLNNEWVSFLTHFARRLMLPVKSYTSRTKHMYYNIINVDLVVKVVGTYSSTDEADLLLASWLNKAPYLCKIFTANCALNINSYRDMALSAFRIKQKYELEANFYWFSYSYYRIKSVNIIL